MSNFFTVFYTLELLLKIVVFQLAFFTNEDAKWNWFDFSLVLSGDLLNHTI